MTEDSRQYLFIIRHGDRWDYANPEWKKLPDSRTGDSPLSTLGHQQAQEVGKFLDRFLDENELEDITWMSSPFLRCIQTSNEALNAMKKLKGAETLPILPEYSIFEWDGHGGEWHDDLPPLSERKHYFPRLDTEYESFFTPALPGETACRTGTGSKGSSPLSSFDLWSHFILPHALQKNRDQIFLLDVRDQWIAYTDDFHLNRVKCW